VIHLLDTALADFAVVCTVRPAMAALFAIFCLPGLALVEAMGARDKAGIALHGLVQAEQEQTTRRKSHPRAQSRTHTASELP
jgi:hypothetical protein